MNSLIEQIYRKRLVEDAQGHEINPFPTSISRDKGETLHRLVREIQPSTTLEIGMAYGLSSLFICQAHTDNRLGGTHLAIDPHQNSGWKSIGLLNVKRAGFEPMFTFLEGPSYLKLPELLREKSRFDFIFIDGSHLFDYVLVDFFFVDLLLNEGGSIVFDDLWMPAIQSVIAFILSNRHYEQVTQYAPNQEMSRVEGCSGATPDLAILRKTGGDNRPWDHFASFQPDSDPKT